MKKQDKQPKPKKKKSVIDFGLFLLVTGALANITIWIGAFVSTEADGPVSEWVRTFFLPVLGGISGLAMGVTVTAGLVYVLARLSQMKPTIERKVRGKDEYKASPNIRFYGAWVAIVLLLVISPSLLAPYVFMTISGKESLYAVLGITWAGVWSIGRIVAADLAMSSVALVHGVHFAPAGESVRPTQPKKTAEQTKSKGKSRGKSTAQQTSRARTMAEQMECKWHCGESGSKAAMNAHSRFCSSNPANQFAKAAQQANR